MVERREFNMVRAVEVTISQKKPNYIYQHLGTISIPLDELVRAVIENYGTHHIIIWLSLGVGECAHQVTVKEDPMKFINPPEGE